MAKKNHYVLIVAGGSGTRLYPRSREAKPKQFQNIIGGKTLIEQTFERVSKTVPKNRIFISSHQRYGDLIKKYLPSIPSSQLILEPFKRNTAPAMAVATKYISRRDKEAVITSVHSDHLVLKPKVFSAVLKTSHLATQKLRKKIIAIGIQPTSPHTGYGYIERGKLLQNINGFDLHHVQRFVEKPDKKTALNYLRQGTFSWNAGYFTWYAPHFLSVLKKHNKKIYSLSEKIFKNFTKENFKKFYQQMPDEPIDTAIMEKTDLALILADLSWSDVGSWDSVSALIDSNELDNAGNYKEGTTVEIDTHNSLILSHSPSRLIATIGLNNVIIVTTPDVVLVCEKGRAEEVKKVVKKIKEKKLKHLL